MKYEVPSAFILNRNDVQYFYVEGKNYKKKTPTYHVYYGVNQKPVFFEAENFGKVHGIDEVQRISTFTFKAGLDLRKNLGTNPEADETYNSLCEIYNQVVNKQDKNINLNKTSRNKLIKAIDSYNKIKDSLSQEVAIPFEENYRLVNNIKDYEQNRVKNIENYQENIEEVKEKGLQRVLKQAA